MTSAFDPALRFVRIVQRHANGLVEFEFAVGEPGLYVEMQLPQSAFDEFCATQGVQPTDGAWQPAYPSDGSLLQTEAAQVARELGWTLHDALRAPGGPGHP